jgi:hypothetical protein
LLTSDAATTFINNRVVFSESSASFKTPSHPPCFFIIYCSFPLTSGLLLYPAFFGFYFLLGSRCLSYFQLSITVTTLNTDLLRIVLHPSYHWLFRCPLGFTTERNKQRFPIRGGFWRNKMGSIIAKNRKCGTIA